MANRLDSLALLGMERPTLLGDPQGMMGPALSPVSVPTYAPPAPQPQQPAKKGVGFLNVLDALFADGDVGDALAKVKARRAARAQQEQLLAAINSLPEEERIIAMADPKGWAEAKAKGLEPYTLSEGQIRGQGGKATHVAPKTVEMGDDLVRTGPDGTSSIYTRPQTHAEKTTQQRVEAEIKNMADRLGIDQAQLVEMIRSHKASEGIAAGNLGVARGGLGLRQQEHQARLKGVGGYGTPGVSLGRVVDPADVEVQ